MIKKKTIGKLITLLVVLGGLGVGGYFLWTKVIQKSSAKPAGQALVVKRGDLVEKASASGTIQPHVQVDVKSRTSGQVIEILTTEGKTVKSGELLAKLDPADVLRDVKISEISLQKVQADVASAWANVNAARLDLDNALATQQVSNRGLGLGLVSSESDRGANHSAAVANNTLKQRQAQASASQAQLASALIDLEDAKRKLTYTEIFAPMDGTVLAVQAVQGTIVSSALTNVSGGSTLMTIADLSDLRVIGQIDEASISRVAVGYDVVIRVDAYPERGFEGKVSRVSPLGKTVSNVVTFDVEIVVSDKDANLLRSGMSADVEITTATHDDVLLLPLLAIQSKGRGRFVTLENGEQRRIKTGPTDGTQIVVTEGLEEGDKVLVVSPAAASGGGQRPSGGGMPMGMPRGGRL